MKKGFKVLITLMITILSLSNFAFAKSKFSYEKVGDVESTTYENSVKKGVDYDGALYVNEIKMTQDNDNFYLDYDIDYKNEALTFDESTILDTHDLSGYGISKTQSVDAGQIILTSKKDSEISLNTSKKIDNKTTYYVGSAKANDESSQYDIEWYYNGIFDNSLNKYEKNDMLNGNIVNISFDSVLDGNGYSDNKFAPTLHSDKTYGKFFNKGNATITQNTMSKSSDYFYFNYKGIITIPKNEIDNYKYISLISPKAVKKEINYVSDTNFNVVYDSVYGSSIKVEDLITCGFTYKNNIFTGGSGCTWEYTNSTNKDTHEKYCPKCHFLKRENHNLQYEYDGILNNACECGYIGKVNYHFIINDDYTTEISKTFDSFSNYEKIQFNKKAGFKFLGYRKYEKEYSNTTDLYSILSATHTPIINKFIATTSILTDKTGLYSTTYEAMYKPISFKVVYSNENKYNLPINVSQTLDINYSSNTLAKAGESVDNYTFKGWGTNKNSVSITEGELLKGLTETDGAIITLYAIYEKNNNKKLGTSNIGGGNGNGGLIKSPMMLGSPSPTSVSVSVDKIPKVDVMVAVDNRAVEDIDISHIDTDIIASLSELGIDTSDTEIFKTDASEVRADNLDFSNVVNSWTKIGEPAWVATTKTIGGVSSQVITCNFTTDASGRHSYKGSQNSNSAILSNEEVGKFDVSFKSEANNNMCNGFCFNVQQNNASDKNRLSGYFFTITSHIGNYTNPTGALEGVNGGFDNSGNNHTEACKTSGLGYGIYGFSLWKMENWDFSETSGVSGNGSWGCYGWGWNCSHDVSTFDVHDFLIKNGGKVTCLKSWKENRNPNFWNTYEVSYEKGHIQIFCTNYTGKRCVADVNDNTYKYGKYGFWGTNCEQVKSMAITDFIISAEKSKNYGDVLSNYKWRENSIHCILNINNKIEPTLSSPSIITNTLNDNIKYCQWGSNENKSFIEDFYKTTDNYHSDNKNFIYYLTADGGDYNTAIKKTAEYIKWLIDQEYYSQYLLVGNKVNLNVSPPSMKTGAISADFPSGRWQVNHDYTYFTNNMGLSNNMGEYSPNLQCDFDKVGLYTINFDDELLKNVYVHRMPIADFNIEIDDTNLTFTNNSYDLDREDIDNGLGKGIKKADFTYKNLTADPNTWHTGKPTSWNKSDVIVIKLEIEDFQEQKAYCVKYIGHGEPQALFNLEKQIVSNFSTIKAHDTSYDPKGASIVAWNYELKKGGVFIASSSEAHPQFTTEGLALGTYTLYLQVRNEVGDSSNTYSKQLVIVEDLDNPFFIASPSKCEWTKKQQIDLELFDMDAGIKQYKYAFHENNILATSGYSSWINRSIDTIYTPDTTNELYLSIIAEDNNGNTMQKVIGTYKIDNSNPTIASFSVVKKGYDNTELTIYANDTGSGVKNFYITKTPLATNSNVEHLFTDNAVKTITSTGHYYLYVIDKVGNFEWDLSSGNVYEIGSIDVDHYVPVSRGGGGASNGGETFSQAYLDSLNKVEEIPEIPILPPKKWVKPPVKNKSIFDYFKEIYSDFETNHNIKSGKPYDLIDLIKDIFIDFNKSKK